LRYGSQRFAALYTPEEEALFQKHLGALDQYDTCNLDQLKDIFLGIYANPVETSML